MELILLSKMDETYRGPWMCRRFYFGLNPLRCPLTSFKPRPGFGNSHFAGMEIVGKMWRELHELLDAAADKSSGALAFAARASSPIRVGIYRNGNLT